MTALTAAEQKVTVGSKSKVTCILPEKFFAKQEDEQTVFIMPRKDDLDGPISLRFSTNRDIRESDLTVEQVRQLLKKMNKTENVSKADKNLYSTMDRGEIAPDGIEWKYKHYMIYADGFIITATTQTIVGREKEPQCKELQDQMTSIISSLEFEETADRINSKEWKLLSDQAEKALYTDNDFEKAIKLYSEAIELNPDNPGLYGNRGNAYSYSKNLNKAMLDFDKAIEITIKILGSDKAKPLCYFYYNKAYSYDLADMHESAILYYKKVISIDSKYPDAHGHLAWILATSYEADLREPKNAIKLIKHEIELFKGKDAGLFDTLAAAYASDGQFDKAIQTQEKAIKMMKNGDGKAEFIKRLKLYKNKKPYIQTV